MTLPIKGGGVLRTSSYVVLIGRSTLCTPHEKQKLHEFPGEGAMKRTRRGVWVLIDVCISNRHKQDTSVKYGYETTRNSRRFGKA